MRRKLLGAALLAAVILAPAQPAFAHGGNGGASSDYRIEVTGYEGDATGIEVHPVELGNRMELVRTTAKEVQILGYEGEPYIRLDADGVFENVNSPAHYINLDRFARKPIPPTATAKATPNWVKISDGNSVRWHDHRTHWMDPTPRADVRANPGVERVIFPANRVDLLVDGKSVGAIVKVTWLPPPSRMVWLVIEFIRRVRTARRARARAIAGPARPGARHGRCRRQPRRQRHQHVPGGGQHRGHPPGRSSGGSSTTGGCMSCRR